MNIITLEGLKGTGKSTLVEHLKKNTSFFFAPKISKEKAVLPNFLLPFKEKYSYFNRVESSLGLKYYAGFFNILSTYSQRPLFLERGLLSLPFYAYYGYYYNSESIPLNHYDLIATEVFQTALNEYKKYNHESTFFILEVEPSIIKKRMEDRVDKIHSDTFFLDYFALCLNIKKRFENFTQKSLSSSKFIHLKNETPEDLNRNLDIIINESKN